MPALVAGGAEGGIPTIEAIKAKLGGLNARNWERVKAEVLADLSALGPGAEIG